MTRTRSVGWAEARPAVGIVLNPSLDEIRVAVSAGQLQSYVQAVVDVRDTGRPLGAESFLRWHHPQRGVLVAAQFLHLVEQAGLLTDVDLATVDHLVADLSRLERAERFGRVWLNLSMSALFSDHLLETLRSLSARAGNGGCRIGLEICATALSADESAAKRRLAMVRALGVGVAIDHLGADLGLPRHFGDFPFDVVKLDRSLIGRIDGTGAKGAVSAAIDVAHGLGATVIAQGVERSHQVEVLRDLGCDGAQGYLFGRPVPLEDLLVQDLPDLSEPEPEPDACTWWG